MVDWSELSQEEKDRYKRIALEDGLCLQLSALHRQAVFDNDAKCMETWLKLQSDPEWRAARALNQARYERSGRLRKRIEPMVYGGEAWFVTLTFRNGVFDTTSQATRRVYVRTYLKERTDFYVANIDFGDHHAYLGLSGKEAIATAREHYHALVIGKLPEQLCENKQYSPDWPYGFSKQIHVRADDQGVKSLPIYISKLTNHALKESVGNTRYIYSRAKYLMPIPWLDDDDDEGS